MRQTCLAIAATTAIFAANPAHATGGYLCKTADGSELEIAVGFGHVPGAPVISSRLRVAGRTVPTDMPQWWLGDGEMRLLMTDRDMLEQVLVMQTVDKGRSFDGWVEWRGKRRWIRCYEN